MGAAALQTEVELTGTTGRTYVSLRSGGGYVALVNVQNGTIQAYDGAEWSTVGPYEAGRRYRVELEAFPVEQTPQDSGDDDEYGVWWLVLDGVRHGPYACNKKEPVKQVVIFDEQGGQGIVVGPAVRLLPGRSLARSASYDRLGRVRAVYGAGLERSSFGYDGLGRLVETKNDAGATVTTHEYVYSGGGTYDPSRPNRVTTLQHGSAYQATTTWLDGLGREIGTTSYEDAAGRASSHYDDVSILQYDGAGRPSWTWRPARVSAGRTRTPTAAAGSGEYWDGGVSLSPAAFAAASAAYWDGRPNIPSSDASTAYTVTEYEASPLGRPTFVRDPGADGAGVTYRYGVDRPDAAFPGKRPEGAAPAMAYVEAEDADGRRSRTYTDGLGRERFVRAGIGSPEETLTETLYDAADRAVELRPPNYFRPRAGDDRTAHRTLSTYDTRGRLVAVTTPDAGTTTMAYDPAGRLRLRQDADQRSKSRTGRRATTTTTGRGGSRSSRPGRSRARSRA